MHIIPLLILKVLFWLHRASVVVIDFLIVRLGML